MEIRPAFFDRFRCIADRCKNSCCKGWEIDVDDGAMERYRAMEGPLGEELRTALTRSPDGSRSFRLTPEGDCPFLRADGLCRLILEEGEDFLCDICALHPRFYEDVGDHELSGLGMCCEAAAALLLEEPGELLFLDEEDRPMSLAALLNALGMEISPEDLSFSPTPDPAYYRSVFDRYARCEAIDQAWTVDLATLAADPESCARAASVYITSYDPAVYDRIFGYLLYRQLELAGGVGLPALLRYAREGTDFILLWTAVTGDLPGCFRRWSAQMEYSTENVGLLLDSLVSEGEG